jgi:hypothetical protein
LQEYELAVAQMQAYNKAFALVEGPCASVAVLCGDVGIQAGATCDAITRHDEEAVRVAAAAAKRATAVIEQRFTPAAGVVPTEPDVPVLALPVIVTTRATNAGYYATAWHGNQRVYPDARRCMDRELPSVPENYLRLPPLPPAPHSGAGGAPATTASSSASPSASAAAGSSGGVASGDGTSSHSVAGGSTSAAARALHSGTLVRSTARQRRIAVQRAALALMLYDEHVAQAGAGGFAAVEAALDDGDSEPDETGVRDVLELVDVAVPLERGERLPPVGVLQVNPSEHSSPVCLTTATRAAPGHAAARIGDVIVAVGGGKGMRRVLRTRAAGKTARVQPQTNAKGVIAILMDAMLTGSKEQAEAGTPAPASPSASAAAAAAAPTRTLRLAVLRLRDLKADDGCDNLHLTTCMLAARYHDGVKNNVCKDDDGSWTVSVCLGKFSFTAAADTQAEASAAFAREIEKLMDPTTAATNNIPWAELIAAYEANASATRGASAPARPLALPGHDALRGAAGTGRLRAGAAALRASALATVTGGNGDSATSGGAGAAGGEVSAVRDVDGSGRGGASGGGRSSSGSGSGGSGRGGRGRGRTVAGTRNSTAPWAANVTAPSAALMQLREAYGSGGEDGSGSGDGVSSDVTEEVDGGGDYGDSYAETHRCHTRGSPHLCGCTVPP